jgi:acyl dehydratase
MERPVIVQQLATGDTVGPLTRTDLVRYVGASGDFNPVHHDDDAARAAGYPTILAPGMFQAGLLATFAVRGAPLASLRSFEVRFVGPVWPGDTLRFDAAEVPAAGERVLDLTCTNGDGRVVLTGRARFVANGGAAHAG